MSANTPPKPHTEGMVFTNDETGIKYQFSGGAWRAVSSSASEEVAEAIDNLDLQKVLDTGNVADKGATFGGKVIVEPGTEGNEAVTYSQLTTQLNTPTFDDVLQEGNVADTEATFKKPVTIDMPHSVSEPLIIKGTSYSGTVNSKVLFVQNTSTPTNRTSVRYRGIVDDSYDITNKKYVDSQRTPTPFTWTLEEKISGVGLSSGCMRWDSGKFIYLSPYTYEGIQLLNPTDLATGANNFSSYLPSVGSGVSLARTMKIWKQSSSGAWQLKAWMIPYRYRFWYVGWVQIEYKGVEGDMTADYGSRYGLSLPDLF
jgi:hypothetical protein